MTQEKADELFKSEIGQQLNVIYVTVDDRPFARYKEATAHVRGDYDGEGQPLEDPTITEWFSSDN